MSPAEVIERATEDGVLLTLLPSGNISAKGEQSVIERWIPEIRRSKPAIVLLLRPGVDRWSAEDWQTFFHERAGIAEYDGGQSRAEAEAVAFEHCVAEWINRNPEPSDPDRCAWCGKPDQDEHTVVPFGTADHGHAWLHPECWQEWHERRREQARKFLMKIGVQVPSATSEIADLPDELGRIGGEETESFGERQAKEEGQGRWTSGPQSKGCTR